MLVATVTMQRSGSKLLGSCFNQGTVVRSFGEVFNPDAANVLGAFTEFVESRDRGFRKRGSDTVLDEYFQDFTMVHGIIHFDLMFNQAEIPCLSWNPYQDLFAYGYLKSRRAVVISLERESRDCYVSGQYLRCTGAKTAHYFTDANRAACAGRFVLDIKDYRSYCQTIARHRQRLYEAMSDYPYFIKCRYEDLAQRCRLPDELVELIERSGKEHGIKVNKDLLQLLPPPIAPTSVNYRDVFENFDELGSPGPMRATA